MDLLFNGFSAVTAAQWKEQIIKDLKGKDFKELIWKTNNDFDVKPFYTSEDQKEQKWPITQQKDWDICEQITVNNEKEANLHALNALKGGASGLSFYILKKIDTKALLKDISLEHIYAQFFISNDTLHVLKDLDQFYGKTNSYENKIKCFVNIDPLSLLAYYGEWHANEEKDFSVLNQLVHIPVNVSLYLEAGANTVNELAIGLAHLNEYFNYLDNSGKLKSKTLHFTFSVGGDFFNEIAKFRAFRKLLTLLQKQYNVDFPVHIHAQTALINKSSLDAYTNMLRTSTEGMSAVIGSCNSLCILPFDQVQRNQNSKSKTTSLEFGDRISRNQQHIFKDETYLNKVADISAGSYYLESLTDELAEKAWEQFKAIEKKGGFIACLKSNFIQDLIEENAAKIQTQVQEGKMVLVGVNKFKNPRDEIKPVDDHASTNAEKKTMINRIKTLRWASSFEMQPSPKSV